MSGSFTQHNNDEKPQGSSMVNIINRLLGKIFLKKPVFFGVDEHKITLIVSPSMKIYGVYTSPKRLLSKFPFEEKKFLNIRDLKLWAEDNEFKITFSAETPKLRRELLILLGDVMVESKGDKEKELSIVVMQELKKSKLPESIKEWAKENPEKFIKNIRHVQNILKK